MSGTKTKSVFIQGAISPDFIARCITKHHLMTQIGAHDIFLGQVRSDIIDGKEVKAIEYSAYEEMANRQFFEIKAEAFQKFDLSSLHIYHSIGQVNTGEICLFVFASSAHRKTVFEALQFVVEQIKQKVPVFGKELFEGDSYQWKVNT